MFERLGGGGGGGGGVRLWEVGYKSMSVGLFLWTQNWVKVLTSYSLIFYKRSILEINIRKSVLMNTW